MSDDNQPPFEIVLELPELLKDPVVLPNGDVVDVGDMIEHTSLGVGKVIRIATYHDHLGILLCVEFPNDQHEMLGLNFVRKVNPNDEKSPGRGSVE